MVVANQRSFSGIQGEFVDVAEQSCLNRFLTELKWDAQALKDRRLEWMLDDRSTGYHEQEVMVLVNL